MPQGKTLPVKALLAALVLSCASVGCGDRILGGASTDGEAADSGVQGVGAASVCADGSVTFQLNAAAHGSGFFVLQAYPTCWNSNWVKIFDSSSAERLLIQPSTSFDCSTCAPLALGPNLICTSTPAAPTQSATWVWDGQYFGSAACGAAAAACTGQRCAPAGHYLVAMCASGDPQGATGRQCVDVPFDYPAHGPVMGTLSAPAPN